MQPVKGAKSSRSLDSYDLAILERLQENNQTPHHVIGAAVHLSAAAVQRRIRNLENAGVIQSNVAVLDPALVGREITLIVGVQVDSERMDRLEETRTRLASAPEVQQCYYVTGDLDFVLIITARSMGDYEQISRRLFLSDPNVKHFKTHVAMSRVKSGLRLPLFTNP